MSSGPDLPPTPTAYTPPTLPAAPQIGNAPALPNLTPSHQYGQQGAADQGAISGIQGLSGLNYAQQNYPQFQQATGNITSGAYGAPQIQGGGNTSIAAGNSLVPFANQTLQTAFDPQSALYDQQRQLNTDQTRATSATQGVAGTPYGAGVENKSNQDFNLAWQNAQLARQAQGASTAEGLIGQQGQSATTGANLLTGAAQTPLNALSQLNAAGGQTSAVPQQAISDFLAYLQGGTGASQAATGQYAAKAGAGLGSYTGQADALTNLFNAISGQGTNLFSAESGAQTGLYSAESSAALGQQQQNNAGLVGLGSLAGSGLGWLFGGPAGGAAGGTIGKSLAGLA